MNKKIKIIIALIVVLIIGTLLIGKKEESKILNDQKVEESTNDVPSEPPVSIQKAPSSPEEEDPLARELAAAMDELPTADDLKALSSEELHHTPEMTLKGGLLVGEMIEKAENDPARRQETLHFLKDCAENPEVAFQIRAVCWRKTLAQIPEWKLFLPIADADVPDDIKELAIKLP